MKIIVPNELNVSMNSIIDCAKVHWSKYYKMQQNLLNGLTLYFKSLRLVPIENYPVEIIANYYCSKKNRDPDNIAAVKKFWLDALVLAGVLEGDNWKYISSFSDKFSIDRINPRIEIEIRN